MCLCTVFMEFFFLFFFLLTDERALLACASIHCHELKQKGSTQPDDNVVFLLRGLFCGRCASAVKAGRDAMGGSGGGLVN